MNSVSVKCALAVAFLAVGSAAIAQDRPATTTQRVRGQGWGVLSHQTVGNGSTAVNLRLGFPGLTIGVLHGLQQNFDVGARFSLNYSHEGLVRALFPSLKFDVVGRIKLLEGEKVGVGATFGMGFVSTFGATVPSSTVVGISLPLGITAGFPIGSALVASFGLDLPLLIVLGPGAGLSTPMLAGISLEYFLDKSLMLNFSTKMGPTINPLVRISSAELTLQAQLGVALKL